MTLAVKVTLKPNAINQSINQSINLSPKNMAAQTFNPLSNDKNFQLDEIQSNCSRQIKSFFIIMISVFDRLENIVGKSENAG